MTLNRRKAILLGGGAVAATVVMGQTGPFSCTQSVPQWLTAMQAIATTIGAALPELLKAGLSSTAGAEVAMAIADIQQVIGSLSVASTVSTGMDVLTQVENYINYLAPLVLPFVSLIPGGAIISLIVASLPAIEALVGILVTLLSTTAQKLVAAAPALPAAKAGAAFGDLAASQAYLQELLRRAAAHH